MIAAYMLRCGDEPTTSEARGISITACSNTGLAADPSTHRPALPVELVWFEEFDRMDEAYAREKHIQGWSRAKREALLAGRIGDLRTLCKKHFG